MWTAYWGAFGGKMNFLKKYYLIPAILIICAGYYISYKTNNYEFQNKVLQVIKDNEIQHKEYISLENKFIVLSLISEVCITFGITLLITMFFVNYFDKKEKNDFKKELKEIQIETAKNAFLSLFHQIIDESFFNVVKRDIINCKVIRKNARWIYDIYTDSDSNKLVLKRTITYTLQNLSTENRKEPIKISFLNNSYAITRNPQIKYKESTKNKYEDFDINKHTEEKNGYKIITGDIEINSNSSVDIVRVLEQVFNTEFIYETHFLSTPLSGLEIEVNFPKDYQFNISFNSIENDVSQILDTETKKIWKLNGALLRGQGIEFYCEKNNT